MNKDLVKQSADLSEELIQAIVRSSATKEEKLQIIDRLNDWLNNQRNILT